MRIAVINETSAADKNPQILKALDGFGHEIINAGMKEKGFFPELQYIHTGLLTSLLLYTGRADFVIGGCGTGQGYLNAVMQFPGVFCGHILTSLDAWLFAQINGGNCISLALNQGYGWAGDVNLKFIFERLFSIEPCCGYPTERQEPQRASREMLINISKQTHKSMGEILETINKEIVKETVSYPGVMEILNLDTIEDQRVKIFLSEIL